MNRNNRIPKQLPPSSKKKYLNMLMGKTEFLPQLVNKNSTHSEVATGGSRKETLSSKGFEVILIGINDLEE